MTKKINQKYSFDDVFGERKKCDQIESLYKYFQVSLSKEEQETFERHLVGCSICMETLGELNKSESVSVKTVLDAEKADKIFRQNRVQIEEMLNKKYGPRSPDVAPGWRFQLPAYVNAMLVVVVILLIYPSYRSFVLERQVKELQTEIAKQPAQTGPLSPMRPPETTVNQPSEPVISPSLVFPVRIEREIGEKTIKIPFEENDTFTLLLSLPVENFQRFVLEIDRQNQNIWRQEIQPVPGETQHLTAITLHSGYFQEREYQLRISGKQGTTLTQLSVYKLVILEKKRNENP